jgi:predicted Zn finger-like uncharacterized protein
MNVACTACPAKYAVPDERVRGKRVRITCKHCGTFIVVDGTALGAASGSQVGPLPQTAAANAARERRKTMLGIGANPNASAAASLGVPVQSSPRASRAPQADVPAHHAWLVALTDGRREPASLARIVDLFAAGSISASTYIWREGMADWKRPFEIPEIVAALNARGVGPNGARGASLPPPDPEEATRVSFSPPEEALAPPSGSAHPPAPAPGTTTSFDDESVTVARAGLPSNPLAQSRPFASQGSAPPGQKRPTLPPLRPAAGRPALPRPPSEPAPRPRQNTIPPIGSPLPPRRNPTPVPAAAPVLAQSSAPPPPPPPPVVAQPTPAPSAASYAPPVGAAPAIVASAPSMPDASAFVAAAAPGVSASYTAPAHFPPTDVVPRSGPPVALPLDEDPFRRKRGKATTIIGGLIVVAAAAAAGFFYLQPRSAPPPAPTIAAAPPPPPPPAPAPAPTPTATETAEPAASASAAPAAVAVAEKAPAKSSASSPRPKHEESSAPKASPRKAAPSETSESESPSESSTEAAPSDTTSTAERLARASEDAPAAPKGNASDPEFNRDAAAQSLGDAASRADSCRSIGGPSGSGQATVTFAPNGRVSAASVGGEFAGTTVGACIARLFRNVTVPAFSGESVTVSKRFTIE